MVENAEQRIYSNHCCMKITAFYCTMLWADVTLTRSATLLELRFAIKALNICKKWKLIDYFSVEFHTMG